MSANYDTDQFFAPFARALRGKLPEDEIQRDRVHRLLPDFDMNIDLLLYKGKVCVPRKNIKDILRMAPNSPIAGHFSYLKTIDRLQNFHWKSKTRDVDAYCPGCF